MSFIFVCESGSDHIISFLSIEWLDCLGTLFSHERVLKGLGMRALKIESVSGREDDLEPRNANGRESRYVIALVSENVGTSI